MDTDVNNNDALARTATPACDQAATRLTESAGIDSLLIWDRFGPVQQGYTPLCFQRIIFCRSYALHSHVSTIVVQCRAVSCKRRTP